MYLTTALPALCERLDSARASRVANAIVAILGDSKMVGDYKYEYFSSGNVAVLTEVAKFLDSPGGLRAAEDLVLVLRKANSILLAKNELGVALVALCRRLDAAGSARVAEAMTAAARDPKTTMHARALLADAFAVIAGHLTPAQAASLEGTLVDSLLVDMGNAMGDAKSRHYTGLVGQALGTTSGRSGATSAARVAEALAAAVSDPKIPVPVLKELTAALAVVCAQLPRQEASSRVHRAMDVLEPRWSATKAPQDRAWIAAALAPVWKHLDRADAAARAQRAAAYLDGALRDPKLATTEILALAVGLSALCDHLDPSERCRHANSGADSLVAALQRARNEIIKSSMLSQALGTLSAHLDQPGVVRIAEALFALMDDSNDHPGASEPPPGSRLDRVVLYEKLFKKVAVRLDERELQRLLVHPFAVGKLQRPLLDALPGSQKRSFRNIWDYLDHPGAHGKG